MHSSRMRTGRSVTVCCSLLPGGGGGSPCQVPGGGVLPARSRGGGSPCQVPGGFSLPGPGGGFSLPGPGGRGVSPCQVLGGGSPCQVPGGSPCQVPGEAASRPPPPPVNRITHTCKNITLATTSLRPVNYMLLYAVNIFLRAVQLLQVLANTT